MADSNRIGSVTRTWPTQPIKKDRPDKKRKHEEKNKENKNDGKKDPGDTLIDEYV